MSNREASYGVDRSGINLDKGFDQGRGAPGETSEETVLSALIRRIGTANESLAGTVATLEQFSDRLIGGTPRQNADTEEACVNSVLGELSGRVEASERLAKRLVDVSNELNRLG